VEKMSKGDVVFYRLIEYRGDAEWVKEQVERSMHGSRMVGLPGKGGVITVVDLQQFGKKVEDVAGLGAHAREKMVGMDRDVIDGRSYPAKKVVGDE
jgi:hypothetical protein